MINVQNIKQAFPVPTRILQGRPVFKSFESCYCVGGAFCLFVNNYADPFKAWASMRFPGFTLLAEELRGHGNPHLTAPLARHFAQEIIAANDRGDFEEAWAQLRSALQWKGE